MQLLSPGIIHLFIKFRHTDRRTHFAGQSVAHGKYPKQLALWSHDGKVAKAALNHDEHGV